MPNVVYSLRLNSNVETKLDQTNSKIDRFEGKLDKTQGKLGRFAKVAGGAFVGLKAIQFGGQLVDLAVKAEQTEVAFETFLGSADKAKKVLKDLDKFSLATPFDPTQVREAGKVLTAFGISQDKLIPSLRAIGDLSSGTGKDFNELAVIFGKARVQGTLFAEDINQLTEAGIPIIDEFAKQFGVSTDEVKKLGSEGRIKFANLEQAFASMTGEGGRFFNLMEKQSKTAGGVFSTLKGNLMSLGESVGGFLLKPLKGIAGAINSLFAAGKDHTDGLRDEERQLRKSRIALNARLNIIKNGNITEEERAKLIKETNEEFKDFLPTLIDEKNTTAELNAIQEEANDNLLKRIILKKREADITEILNKKADLEIKKAKIQEALLDSKVTREEALENLRAAQKGEATSEDAFVSGLKVLGTDAQQGIGGLETDLIDQQLKDLDAQLDSEDELTQKIKERLGLKKEEAKLGGKITGDATKTGGASSRRSSRVNNISGGRPTSVTINISKIIESFVLNANGLKEGTQQMKNEVAKQLLTAVNDVNIIQE